MKAIFGKAIFDYSKSPELILKFLKMANVEDSDIVLDFFSGSATTAHAVMKLNAEDGGKRKFIMVQLPEVTDEKSEARKAGYNTICEIGKERIRRAGKKVKEEAGLQGQDLDIGFRVLKLDTSNMQEVYYTPQDFDAKTLFSQIDNLKTDRKPIDLLFQVMPECGCLFSDKIEVNRICGRDVYNVGDGYLMACFDTDVDESTIAEIAKSEPVYFVMRDASAADDNVLDNFDQLFRHYSPDTIRRIL
jgi:adenine-specific DNA-methyltransferase